MLLGAILLALAPGALAGMYGKPVINLDAKTFKQAMSVEHAAMVAFVAPWCGHCKALGPEYTSAAASLSPLIPFYAVDCDEAPNKPLCAEYGIQGFPTIKAFPRALKGAAKDYHGDRKTDALVDYAKSLVPDRVKKLRVTKDADAKAKDGVEGVVEGWLKDKKDLGHVLLIHPTQPSIPFLWKVLGHRLASKVSVGYIRDTPEHGIISSLGVYDPSDTSRDPVRAVFWPKGAKRSQLVEYDGAFKFNALLEWITAQLDPAAAMPSERDLPSGSSPGAGTKARADTAAKKPSGDSDAERRARLKAKMEEAERRDQARRDKLAQAQKAREAEEEAAAGVSGAVGEGDEEEKVEDGEVATPVDAPAPQAEESVEEEMLNGQSKAEGLADEPEPEPQEVPEGGEGAADVQETRIHEEL